MKGSESMIFRIPWALALGSMAFTVGFVRLMRLSSRFTLSLIRGASPDRALNNLTRNNFR